MRNNVALAVLVALSGTIGACSDRQPLMSRAPARLLDLAPLPPTAETVFADSIDPATGGLPLYYVWTDFARLTFWNFSIPYDFFADGSRRQILVPNSWAPPEWQRVQIDGGKHASAVRVTAYTMTGFAMTCHTKSGGAVSSRIDGPGNFVLVKGVLDVQAPGIAYCTFFGSGGIETLSYVPERDNPKLQLSCDKPAPFRADTITCTTRAHPPSASAALTELVWSFVDSAGHTIPGPTGADTSWTGEIAVSGLMQVSGKVNGVPSSDSLRIRVRARRWSRIRLDARERGHGDLPTQPTNDGDMAHTHVDTLDSAVPIPAHEIADGPNKGWAFVDEIPLVPVTVHLSDAWLPGSTWYHLQHHGFYGFDVNGNPAYYCTQSQVSTLLTLARRHEGAGLHQTNSHIDVMRQYVQNHRQHEDVEGQLVYIPDLGGIRTLKDWFRDDVWRAFIVNPLMNDPRQGHTSQAAQGVVPPALFPCKPRY
jgi:hypothetical protein